MQAQTHRQPAVLALWLVAGVVVFWSFGFTLMRGSDLWWHLAGGRWMVEHGTAIVHEPFAFTVAGERWLNDAWLSSVLLHLWSAAFGLESLAFWKWLMIIATWLLLLRVLTRNGAEVACAFAVATFGLAVAAPFLDVRPQLFSFFCFVLLLEGSLGRRPAWWLPLLYLAWANLHAGFLLGIILLPALWLPAFLEQPQERRRLLLLGLACIIVCLVNPNGSEAISRPLRYAFDSSSPFRGLGEWLPPFQPGGIRSWLYPYAIGAFASATLVVAVVQARGPRDWRVLVAAAIGTLTLLMSLRSRRFVPFFAIGHTLVLAYAVDVLVGRWVRRAPAVLAPLAALGLGIYWLSPYPLRAYAFDYLTAHYEFPIETMNFVETNALKGKVFNYYNWGGYVNLRTDGSLQVYIDGRADMLYPDAIFVDYLKVLHQKPGWEDVIDASGAEFVLWPFGPDTVARTLLQSGKWRAIYQDHKSVLLVRQGVPLPSTFRDTPDTPFRHLMLGWALVNQRQFAAGESELRTALQAMPHLVPACTALSRTLALQQRFDDGRQVIEDCQATFPVENQVATYDAFVAQLQQAGTVQ